MLGELYGYYNDDNVFVNECYELVGVNEIS